VVVSQFDDDDVMNPRGLLVAYEENGRVQPVASDFDAFLIGSLGLEYPEMPPDNLAFVRATLATPSRHRLRAAHLPSAAYRTREWLGSP
jgi:hypothetical protein